ncbi:N5-glutamine methyltransferase family protein [Paenibacillus koleovorans]|uniref:N5-glutamine methyltransferase family protein n=1 Tax=Paenibacillus koleovorans TaxID=121608 RepID=UPI000FDB4C7D|nr:HemK/PrmC family methyltransferase [Paenibacillus koleovorans]
MTTIREAYMRASLFLGRHGVEENKLQAELLLGYVLGMRRTELLFRWSEPFPEEHELAWERYLARRASGEPVQYITGEQEFYGLAFHVERAVLIPRPETELLVEQIVSVGRELWGDGAPVTAADIGTGSGAIAVAVAVQRPAWRVHAVDLSSAALQVARGNAARHGVAERVVFHHGDLLGPLMAGQAGDAGGGSGGAGASAGAGVVADTSASATGASVSAGAGVGGTGGLPGVELDVVVSNPPYIETKVIEELDVQVKDFEPRLALDGGPDGLVLYRRLAEQLGSLVRPPQLVGLEVGSGQARAVAMMLDRVGHWGEIRVVKDLAGIERHVVAVRR